MPFTDKVSFRCKKCGHLEGPEHAGENDLLHACSVCGAGVILNPRTAELSAELADPKTTVTRIREISTELAKLSVTGENEKKLDPSNWEVLADCPKSRHKELGIESNIVHRHVGKKADGDTVSGKVTKVVAAEGTNSKNRAG